ncbi:MAG TPA: VWA domain-containing protein [Acidobacteriota bacterium]|nr:VWA domain-containing protein [Acidobacteriota bacterium]
MPQRFLALVLLVVIEISVTTASGKPVQAPKDSKQDDDVVRISTTLVQVDAVVTDKKGRVIPTLKAEDFELLVDGKPQTISHFEYVATEPLTTSTEAVTAPAGPMPTPPLPANQTRRTIALVVDDLGLSFESLPHVRKSLKKFVDEQMRPTDLVAILRTGAGIGALQRFTSDRRQLHAAIDNLKWSSVSRTGQSAIAALNESAGINRDQPSVLDKVGNGGSKPASGKGDPTLVKTDVDQVRTEIFAAGTLGAIRQIVRGLEDLPGRKSIMLFSDGFQIFGSDRDNGRIVNLLRRLTDLANRASVVIYSLDTRGLQTLNITAADAPGSVTPGKLASVLSQRQGDYWNGQEGLNFLAQETGGLLLKNTNDFSRSIETVLKDQAGYYLLGFVPEENLFQNGKADFAFHKIRVRVKQPDVNVRSRNGFLGVTDEQVAQSQSKSVNPLLEAVLSPFVASDIRARLTSMFGNEAATGPHIQSMLFIDASDVQFTENTEKKRFYATLEVLSVTIGAEDKIVDQALRQITIELDEAGLKLARENGLVQKVILPVKIPGAYQLRVGIRDAGSAHIGSVNQFVEVPNLKKGALALSGIMAAGMKPAAGNTPPASGGQQTQADPEWSAPEASPAVRRIQRGNVVHYGYDIFNPQVDSQTHQPNLEVQVTLFRDGQLVFQGQPRPLALSPQNDWKQLRTGGQLQLGTQMDPGQYVLQLTVTDKVRKKGATSVSQWVDFEVLE